MTNDRTPFFEEFTADQVVATAYNLPKCDALDVETDVSRDVRSASLALFGTESGSTVAYDYIWAKLRQYPPRCRTNNTAEKIRDQLAQAGVAEDLADEFTTGMFWGEFNKTVRDQIIHFITIWEVATALGFQAAGSEPSTNSEQ